MWPAKDPCLPDCRPFQTTASTRMRRSIRSKLREALRRVSSDPSDMQASELLAELAAMDPLPNSPIDGLPSLAQMAAKLAGYKAALLIFDLGCAPEFALAAQSGNLEACQAYLLRGCAPECPDVSGKIPILAACSNIKCFPALLDACAARLSPEQKTELACAAAPFPHSAKAIVERRDFRIPGLADKALAAACAHPGAALGSKPALAAIGAWLASGADPLAGPSPCALESLLIDACLPALELVLRLRPKTPGGPRIPGPAGPCPARLAYAKGQFMACAALLKAGSDPENDGLPHPALSALRKGPKDQTDMARFAGQAGWSLPPGLQAKLSEAAVSAYFEGQARREKNSLSQAAAHAPAKAPRAL